MTDQAGGGEIREPLILRDDAVTGGVPALFAAMRADDALRRRFAEDPAGVLAKVTGNVGLPPQRLSSTNRLVFSLLGNAELVDWLRSYAEERRGEPIERTRFSRDFAEAVLEHGHGSPELDIIRNAIRDDAGIRIAPDASPFIHHSDFLLPGIAVTTDHKVQQHQTQDQVQDAQTRHDHSSTQSFTPQTHFTTPHSGVDPEEDLTISPEWLRITVDALVNQAGLLRRSRLLDVDAPLDLHLDSPLDLG
ncbi:hypothetical protein Sru01_05550 [Sphaerisporangium rufum]|uniref:Uncharacterized protein n=1 Tax=Sphaerisporangium rufum TaxID=1381558 RepID=A0A919QXC6_9ACTN|nr:hypothetical protein [Sphaerisporangium rufum]GII75573.1 hypothetical protein Sru01_05550 [Sphaerisporangium rufum]